MAAKATQSLQGVVETIAALDVKQIIWMYMYLISFDVIVRSSIKPLRHCSD